MNKKTKVSIIACVAILLISSMAVAVVAQQLFYSPDEGFLIFKKLVAGSIAPTDFKMAMLYEHITGREIIKWQP